MALIKPHTVVGKLLGSRKAVVTITSIVLLIASSAFGAELPEDTVLSAVAIIVSFLVGQGIADHGKEAAAIHADAAKALAAAAPKPEGN